MDMKRKTPLKRTPFKNKKGLWKSLKSTSKFGHRRVRRNIPMAVMVKLKERSNGLCERCGSRATEAHHKLGRAQGGEHTLENLIHLDMRCHLWIHSNPKLAIQEGFMIPYKNYTRD